MTLLGLYSPGVQLYEIHVQGGRVNCLWIGRFVLIVSGTGRGLGMCQSEWKFGRQLSTQRTRHGQTQLYFVLDDDAQILFGGFVVNAVTEADYDL